MCFASKAPAAPPVAPAPTREEIAATAAADKADATVKAVTESREKTAKRQGVYDDIHTSRTGDYYYAKSSSKPEYAKFGYAGAPFRSAA